MKKKTIGLIGSKLPAEPIDHHRQSLITKTLLAEQNIDIVHMTPVKDREVAVDKGPTPSSVEVGGYLNARSVEMSQGSPKNGGFYASGNSELLQGTRNKTKEGEWLVEKTEDAIVAQSV
uniref:Maf-like protein n=1 Tax=Steinernema glaseri TaxID=37863 RepID=A0A1I7ZZK7_9BILA